MKKDVLGELERIKDRSKDGLLHPEEVVAAAAKKNSALHGYFEWDDARAANAYRLDQARTLIQAAVIVEPRLGEKVRAYVSLSPSRAAGGGYHGTGEVLDSAALRRIFLADALRDVEALRTRYAALPELAPIWSAAEAVKATATEASIGPSVGVGAPAA